MKIAIFVGVAALIVSLVLAGPLLILWSLNILFPALGIPYNVWTWLATLILAVTVSPTVKVTKR
jgi:hypothetical protein